MAVIAHVTLRGIGAQQYDALRSSAGWLQDAPGGGLAHLTWFEGPDCHSVDAWDSEEAFAAFGERRLGPALAAVGIDVAPEVTFSAAHEVFLPRADIIAPTATPEEFDLDDVALVRRGYQSFATGDIPAVLGLMDDQVVWTTPDTVRFGGRFVGPAAVAGFFGSLAENFAELAVEPTTFLRSGDTIAVLGNHRGRTVSGVPFELPWVHVWTIANGKASSFTEHFDTVRLNAALGMVAQPTAADSSAARATDPETLVRRIFEEVVNQGRMDAIPELFSEDFLDHGPMGDQPGRDTFAQRVAQWRDAVPDVHCEVTDVLVDGDRAAWLVHTTGTHTGDGLGFPATGRSFETVSANIGRMRGGQACEHWSEQGMLPMLQQLGLLPMPAETTG